jgi:hypothetical protein
MEVRKDGSTNVETVHLNSNSTNLDKMGRERTYVYNINSLKFDLYKENIEIACINETFIYSYNNFVSEYELIDDKPPIIEKNQIIYVLVNSNFLLRDKVLVSDNLTDEINVFLVDFVNEESSEKYDLLRIAIAHHRLVWIHPFENGNGRVVRLFTYALLLKFVFKSKDRIINPTAVFCSDRKEYYIHLSFADNGTDEGMIAWAEYMLKGLKSEIEKLDKLLDYNYLYPVILSEALKDAREREYITKEEYTILEVALKKVQGLIQSSDIADVLPSKSKYDRSRVIKSLVEKKMLRPIKPGARKYYLYFSNNYLMRSILAQLDKNGFLPDRY